MTRINDRIRAPKVRVVDGETNQQIGVMTPQEAIFIAKQRGLDLVEVSAEAKPPVCKIVSYGKYKYQQSKQKVKVKSSAGKVKEVKFRINISPHDYGIKLSHAEEFLDHNNKIRIHLQFKGREMAHQELGFDLMMRIQGDLKGMGHVDMQPKQAGRSISMMLSPLAANQRHRKFAKPVAEYVEDEDFADADDEEDEEDAEGHTPHVHTLSLEEILDKMEGEATERKGKKPKG
jgi:translation initiation factor IF-3